MFDDDTSDVISDEVEPTLLDEAVREDKMAEDGVEISVLLGWLGTTADDDCGATVELGNFEDVNAWIGQPPAAR